MRSGRLVRLLLLLAVSGLMDCRSLAASPLATRAEAWNIAAGVMHTFPDGSGLFDSWHPATELFAHPSNVTPASAGLAMQSSEAQIIIVAAYNEAAYQHIRRHNLNDPAELEHLRVLRPAGGTATIPNLPDGSEVLLTAWWPVGRGRITAMPIWDARLNPPLRGGNGYITWRRAIGIECCARDSAPTASIEFAGRSFPAARRVGLDAFRHIAVDARMAEDFMRDDSKRKAAVIALGRPLEAGDYLVLVAMHVAAKLQGDWAWVTLWWHDESDAGPFARGRPDSIKGAWRHYLLDAVLERSVRAAPADSLPACFNPWFEARFPQSGAGGGTASNCLVCHRRASYPPVNFLPLPSGAADTTTDPAFAPQRVRTDSLWSLARQGHSLQPPAVAGPP